MSKKTPMEQQYDSIKQNHQDKLLLFRLGDFYEVFNEDAVIAAQVLNIALTKRHDKPMCGFPHHAVDQYAYKLVEAGHKVAICEQVEDARQAKGIVKRDVVSILTKGTWSENPLLDHSINSFLAIVSMNQQELVLAFVDVVTGEIFLRSTAFLDLSFISDELARYMPVETICMREISDLFALEEELKTFQKSLRLYDSNYFTETDLFHIYQEKFPAINDYSLAKRQALFGLFAYLQENHFNKSQIAHLQQPQEFTVQNTVFMNEDTLRHLELVYNSNDFSEKGSLFSVLNKCKTLPASRKLRRLLVNPSMNFSEVQSMQSRTEYFVRYDSTGISELLKSMSDLERLTARLMTGKLLPREALAMSETISRSEKIVVLMQNSQEFSTYLSQIRSLASCVRLIDETIHPDASNSIDGTTIQQGVNAELDSYKEILQTGKDFLITLQAEERIRTGINTLKVAYNKIYGYYIEVSKGAVKNVPDDYMRKQSLVNAERYTIPKLDEYEQKIQKAEDTVLRLEREVYENLLAQLQEFNSALLPLTDFITEVDLRLNLAQKAQQNFYCKPTINEGYDWQIVDGRHPVIETLLHKEKFVSNNTTITKNKRVLIVTGPNMAGKSTYLRQNALFAVMTQIGSFIPAKEAHLSLVDKIFTRIGASDDLSSGRSTFFVEMQEASFIINSVTDRSLVIMDELGRGTSTLDGLSLAWAILEHLLFHPNKKAKIFFSTHYHELTDLSRFDFVQNLCMAIKENKGKPIFLRKVVEGKASKSYGIHVAEMAGMDASVIARAQDILLQLEKGAFFKQKSTVETSLFTVDDPLLEQKNEIYESLKNVDPNALSPLDALRILYELKNIQS